MSRTQLRHTCSRCRLRATNPLVGTQRRSCHETLPRQLDASRPSIAPKPSIDIKHIRQNPTLYEQSCKDRNYLAQSRYPARINELFEQWQDQQRQGRRLRERSNLLRRQLSNPTSFQTEIDEEASDIRNLSRAQCLADAKALKEQLSSIAEKEELLISGIDALATAIPNLTSDETPRGDDAQVVEYINEHPDTQYTATDRVWRSHVHIGSELDLLDFAASATSSGWGWYYLLNDAALLEQALVQYSLSVAMSYGWSIVSPPSIIYSHIGAACGFQPRDQNGEQQVYSIAQSAADAARGKPELSLAGTAEIPLAAMRANTTIDGADLPIKHVAVSRSYRAEAGARGVDTKGLYRVHEFTKVELFGWSAPDAPSASALFDEILQIQRVILESLDLHCRILEMPSTDLGASATRKRDIEAFFPGRRAKDEGWGEVTSTSICSDYQTRRLATRTKVGGKLLFPWTVNGTAMAVPRVLAAILENGWVEDDLVVRIPKVLRPWMGGQELIRRQKTRAKL